MANCPSNARYKRILALGTDRLSIINTALAAGESPRRVAQTIQIAWQQLTDVSTATLAKQLARYRAEIVPTLIAPVTPGGAATYRQPAAFDVHDRLCELVSMQWKRFQLGHARELQAGFPISTMTKEVETLKDMLLAQAKLEFELGILEYKGHAKARDSDSRDHRIDVQVRHALAVATAIIDEFDPQPAQFRQSPELENKLQSGS